MTSPATRPASLTVPLRSRPVPSPPPHAVGPATLVVVGFPTVQEAMLVRGELVDLQREQLVALEDAVVVEHGVDGRVHLHQTLNLTAAGAMGGGFWGTLVGLLFFNPLLGTALGAGVGALSGALTDLGLNDGFLREIGDTLPPGHAALAVLLRQAAPDRVIERLRRHAPQARLLRTNLSHSDEDRLRHLLERVQHPGAGDPMAGAGAGAEPIAAAGAVAVAGGEASATDPTQNDPSEPQAGG